MIHLLLIETTKEPNRGKATDEFVKLCDEIPLKDAVHEDINLPDYEQLNPTEEERKMFEKALSASTLGRLCNDSCIVVDRQWATRLANAVKYFQGSISI